MLFLKFYLRTLSISRYFWLFNIAWKPPNVDTTRSKTDIKNNAMLIFRKIIVYLIWITSLSLSMTRELRLFVCNLLYRKNTSPPKQTLKPKTIDPKMVSLGTDMDDLLLFLAFVALQIGRLWFQEDSFRFLLNYQQFSNFNRTLHVQSLILHLYIYSLFVFFV